MEIKKEGGLLEGKRFGKHKGLQVKWAAGAGRAVLVCLLAFAAFFAPPGGLGKGGKAQAAVIRENLGYEYREIAVKMEAGYGFDNMAKGGRYLPVYITLTNQKEEGFAGSIQVVSMESDYHVYQYEFPVTLEGNESRQKNLNIPLGVKADQLYVRLYDGEDQLIVQKRLKLNTREDIPELLIGVISDTQDQLQYFNDTGINYSTLKTRLCLMVAGSVPSQAAGLDQLDVLLITNYDVRRMSEDQIATIREWVNRGGVLLLGTGARGTDILEEFLGDNPEAMLNYLGPIQVDMGEGYLFSETGSSKILLECNDITLSEGTVLIESDGMPLLTAVARESGIIAAAAFDFADLAGFCQENPTYVDWLLTELLGETRITRLSDYIYSGTSNTYWAVQSIINAGSVEKLPQIGLYAVVIISYILLAGPGLYFFLKQREMGEHYRISVVLLSLICTGIIYVMSEKTRFTDTFFNYASIQDVSDTVVTESTYINMQAPYNRPYSVKLDPSYTVRPVTRNAYYNAEQIPKFTGEETPNITIRYDEDYTSLEVQNMAAFTSNYFQLEKRFDNQSGQGIDAEVHYFEGILTGQITNRMDCPVEDAAVLLYGTLAVVGDLAPGETKSLEGLLTLNYPVDSDSARATAKQITKGWRYEKVDISDPEYMKTMAKTSLLEFYLTQYLTGYQPGARIVAFRGGEDPGSFLLGDDYETSGLTMFTAAAEADMKKDGRIYRPIMRKAPKVINGIYQASSNTISGMTPVTLEYSLGSALYIEKLTFGSLSHVFMEDSSFGRLRPFEGSIYFYNYAKGDFELMDSSRTEFVDWQLDSYLSPGNTITIRYVCSSTEEYGDIVLPILYVTGREP